MHCPDVSSEMQDHPRTEKADAGNDALNDPACVGRRMLLDRQHRNRRGQRDKPEHPQPRGLPTQLEIDAHQGSDQRCGAKAKYDVVPLRHELNSLAELKYSREGRFFQGPPEVWSLGEGPRALPGRPLTRAVFRAEMSTASQEVLRAEERR